MKRERGVSGPNKTGGTERRKEGGGLGARQEETLSKRRMDARRERRRVARVKTSMLSSCRSSG